MGPPNSTRYDPGAESARSADASGIETIAPGNPHPSGPALTLGFAYYILFRHKWKILLCLVLGVLAAAAASKLLKPKFVSTANLVIRWVEESRAPSAVGDSNKRSPDPMGGSIISTEVAILTSFDLAEQVAQEVGVERILGRAGGPNDLHEAAGVLSDGLRIESSPRNSVLGLSFVHSNQNLVQPAVSSYVRSYLRRHSEVHKASYDENLVQETDQLRAKLAEAEEELRGLMSKAGVISVPEAKRVFGEQIARLQESVMALETELAGSRATVRALTGSETTGQPGDAATTGPVPADKRALHQQISSQIATLRNREQELLVQFTAETPMVKGIRAQIAENEGLKSRLEAEYPSLVHQRPVEVPTVGTVTAPRVDVASEAAKIQSIESRKAVMLDQLDRIHRDVANLGTLEASVREIERRRELLDQQYRYFSQSLEKNRIDQALGAGRVSGITVIQSPTPPAPMRPKAAKIIMILPVMGLGIGLGLAFALEMFLDPSVKRPAEIELSLGLPLVLSLPRVRTASAGKNVLPAPNTPLLGSGKPATSRDPSTRERGGHKPDDKSPVPYSVGFELRQFFDALRNRLIYSFEMRGITRKPKLVAITSCGPKSGVSTIAAGLAASLSETGDGNVLLVDMNPDRKTPQFFHRGDLTVGLDEVLAEETRDDALVRENLYVVSQNSAEDRLNWIMPRKFAALVPKMKASDFDYIIFDMPPVSQISATPQLARYMDQVLLVVESEKTSREAVKYAGTMLSEAGANVGVVLNKTKSYVPKALDHDAWSS